MVSVTPPGLRYGGDYNAEQWPEEVWREDARLMREAGVTTVTVGVFAWALLEPEPGRYEFEWLDRLLDLLHEHGIEVDLATGTASPPAWLVRQHPEVLPVTADGVRLEFGSRQHYCPSSTAFREHAARLAELLATRYKAHPAVTLWHVGNEYGDHVAECFCPRSAADFRRWLAERHGTVERLNEAWGTAFWSQRYRGFDEIEPPRRTPAPPNPTQALDWRRFCSDALLDCYRAERAVLQRICPNQPVTTNFLGLFPALDYWTWAGEEDLVSDDAYPDPDDPEAHVAAALSYDLMRSLRHGQPWLLMESAPSAVSWREVNVPKPQGVRALWGVQALAHGADGVMFFQWRASRSGAEKFHSAMLPHRGTASRGWRETVALGRDLAALAPVAGATTSAQVALLLDWESWWGLELDEHPSARLRMNDLLLRWYRPLWEANITVDLAHPDDDLDAYRLVLAPSLYLLRETTARALAGHVERGGHLVVGPFSGVVDQDDRAHPGALCRPLADLLGIEVDEWAPLPDGRTTPLDCDGAAGAAELWSEWLDVTTAQVWARFTDGPLRSRPAITHRTHGSGTAWYAGCLPDRATTRLLVDEVAERAGVRPVLALPGVEATLRQNADGRYLFLLNHGVSAVDVPLPRAGVDLLDQQRGTQEVLTLEAGRPAVVRLDPAPTGA